MTLSIPNALAIVHCDALADSVDLGSTNPTGLLRFYSGTPPINLDTALSGNTLLSEHAMSNPAFGAASDDTPDAIAVANTIASALSVAAGTCTFFRIVDRDEVDRIQGEVTTVGGGGDIELDYVVFAVGIAVSGITFILRVPEAA